MQSSLCGCGQLMLPVCLFHTLVTHIGRSGLRKTVVYLFDICGSPICLNRIPLKK
jgi:hypothetical protein